MTAFLGRVQGDIIQLSGRGVKKETKGFAETIHYMIREGCTTGVAQNLSVIERFYLRSKQPCRVPFLLPIAQVVSQLKLDRIAEVGKNPNSGSYEERITAMAVVKERVRLAGNNFHKW